MMINIEELDFNKMQGLIPVCVQDVDSLSLLMLGFMNEDALKKTLETKRVTFYSRTKARLWTKGESSGHFLELVSLTVDCDRDSLLILAKPQGLSCHLGRASCFPLQPSPHSLGQSLAALMQRLKDSSLRGELSYTQSLLQEGLKRIAQKVGEEGVEVALAALGDSKEELIGEVVDLLYHLMVLLLAKDLSLADLSKVIEERAKGYKADKDKEVI